VASSTQADAGLPPAFPYPDVAPLFRAEPSGFREVGDDRALVIWARLPSLDWSYVVVGPQTLLEPAPVQ
jgi:hypothetical protein